jgi:hypothetical protein
LQGRPNSSATAPRLCKNLPAASTQCSQQSEPAIRESDLHRPAYPVLTFNHLEGIDIMLNQLKSGAAIATAAAALFSMGATLSTSVHAADDAMVKCVGANSCKGTSDCKSAKSECKGQNSCKGMGWVGKKSAADCTAAGGTVQK